MSFLGKVYKHQKDENYRAYLKTLGINDDGLDYVINIRPTQKFEKSGDEYIFTSVHDNDTTELKFKSGVEFDENVTEGLVAKTTFTVDGNVIKQEQKFPDGGTIITERRFSDNDLLIVYKQSAWDSTASRHYSAA